MLFGGVFLYFLVPEILANLTAANWTLTSCRILSSRVATQESRDGGDHQTLYRVDLRYSYEIAGRSYESTRYRFVDPHTDNRSAAESAVRQYAPGSAAPCYVNPRDPGQAVLDRRLSPFMLIALLPAAIAGMGLWSLVAVGVDVLRRS